MKKKFLLILSFTMCCCAMNLQAQTAIKDGKKVKSITFDKEDVVIIYADDSKEILAGDATVTSSITTGIQNVKTNQGSQSSTWYMLDGRRIQSEPQNKKGIYVVKQGNKVRKTIKK